LTAAVMTALRAANERRTHTSMHTQTWAGRGGGGEERIFRGSGVGGGTQEVGGVEGWVGGSGLEGRAALRTRDESTRRCRRGRVAGGEKFDGFVCGRCQPPGWSGRKVGCVARTAVVDGVEGGKVRVPPRTEWGTRAHTARQSGLGAPTGGQWAPTYVSWPAGPVCPYRGPPSSGAGQGESHEGPLGWVLAGLPRVGGWRVLGHAVGSRSTGCRSDGGICLEGGLPPGDLAHMEAHWPPQEKIARRFSVLLE